MEGINIRVRKHLDLSESMAIATFPTAGLIGNIAGGFLIRNLGMEQIGAVYSSKFPPYAVVVNSIASPPVGIYWKKHACGVESRCKSLCLITAVVPPPIEMVPALAEAILKWCDENGVKLLVTFKGIPVKEKEVPLPGIFGISSKVSGKKILEKYGVKLLSDGTVISGLSGALLSKGELFTAEVITLVSQVHEKHPEYRAAALILKAASRFLLGIKVDLDPLFREAEKIEATLKSSLKTVESAPSMYR